MDSVYTGIPVLRRGGDWFVERPYEGQRTRFREWLKQAVAGRLVVIEIGAGFNTPSVIRWPCEAVVSRHGMAHLVRINPGHPETRYPLGGRCTSIAARAGEVLPLLAGPS